MYFCIHFASSIVKTVRRYWYLLLMGLLLGGCASTGGYIRGQVLDSVTNEPIQDAYVAITWSGDQFAFVETKSVCIHADATVTDVAGKFRFIPWARSVLPTTDVDYQLFVYKLGYEDVNRKPMAAGITTYFIEPVNIASANSDQRVEYLMNLPGEVDCGPSTFDLSDFIPMFRAIYQEALQIGTDDELRLMRNKISQIWSGEENTMTYIESESYFNENIREKLQ